jgi:hypothetical protein
VSPLWGYLPTPGAGGGSGRPGDITSDPGDTVGYLWEEPGPLANGTIQIRLLLGCADVTSWRGARVYSSTDGSTYSPEWDTHCRSTIGVTEGATLGAASGWQAAQTFDVNLSASPGTLVSVTEAQAKAGVNLALLGDEVISFQTATLTSANHYTITGIQRGWYGTTGAAHAAGARFVMLVSQQDRVQVGPAYIGTWHWKATSFNIGGAEQDIADATDYTVIITGAGLTPTYTGVTLGTVSGVVKATVGVLSAITPGGAGTKVLTSVADVLSWAALPASGAPVGASYLTLGLDAGLTAERVLTPGTSLAITDGGANGTYAIDVIQDVRTTAGPTFNHTHLTTLYADHIAETTGSHGVVIDSIFNASNAGLNLFGTSGMMLSNSVGYLYYGTNFYYNSGWKYAAAGYSSMLEFLPGAINLLVGPTGAKDAAISYVTALAASTTAVALGVPLQVDHIAEKTGGHGIVFDNTIALPTTVLIDHIGEATGGHTVVFDNNITLSAKNIVTDTTTGMKIGTVGGAAGQKLGFFGAAPVVQRTHLSDPDAAGLVSWAANINLRLEELGFMRTS